MDAIENNSFWGIVITEERQGGYDMLPYLADTVMEVGTNPDHAGRWFEVQKCRSQHYHGGKHPFRISDGSGVKIYPSIRSVQSIMRRRMKATLSEELGIEVPEALAQQCPSIRQLREKSTTLLWGPPACSKTLLALYLLMGRTQSLVEHDDSSANSLPPRSILVVTFRTSEARFSEMLENELKKRWDAIGTKRIRWFSAGPGLTGAQLIDELWRHITEARREGAPIERVLLDEVEASIHLLPALAQEPLFWPTMMHLLATEKVTTFVVVAANGSDATLLGDLQSESDYVLHVSNADRGHYRKVEIQKTPGLDLPKGATEAILEITTHGVTAEAKRADRRRSKTSSTKRTR
jgi:hypothetical protein